MMINYIVAKKMIMALLNNIIISSSTSISVRSSHELLMMISSSQLLLLKLLIKLPPKLLSIPSLVILKPVEDILAFNLAIKGEMSCDLLDLRCIRCPSPGSVHLLKNHQLLRCWAPSWWWISCWGHGCSFFFFSFLVKNLWWWCISIDQITLVFFVFEFCDLLLNEWKKGIYKDMDREKVTVLTRYICVWQCVYI